jgi:hypothetical protein
MKSSSLECSGRSSIRLQNYCAVHARAIIADSTNALVSISKSDRKVTPRLHPFTVVV